MNKKGFTTIEMILTMVLVIVIMITITEVVFTYRDRSTYEETLASIVNYKNNLTTIIYDDIVNDNPIVLLNEIEANNKYELVKADGSKTYLTIIKEEKKVGILYDEVFYQIPKSDDELVSITGVDYKRDIDNNLYSLDIKFRLKTLEEEFKIHFAIT